MKDCRPWIEELTMKLPNTLVCFTHPRKKVVSSSTPFPLCLFVFVVSLFIGIAPYLQTMHTKSHKWQRRARLCRAASFQTLQSAAVEGLSRESGCTTGCTAALAVLQPYAPVHGSCCCVKSPPRQRGASGQSRPECVSPRWAVGSSLCRPASVSLNAA